MSKKILQKCIEELKSETFRKDYVLGMLETLVDSDSVVPFPHPTGGHQIGYRESGTTAYKTPAPIDWSAPAVSPENMADHIAAGAEAEAARNSNLIERELITETNIVLNSGR